MPGFPGTAQSDLEMDMDAGGGPGQGTRMVIWSRRRRQSVGHGSGSGRTIMMAVGQSRRWRRPALCSLRVTIQRKSRGRL